MNVSDLNQITVNDLLTVSSKELLDFQVKLDDAIEKRKSQDKSAIFDKMVLLATESGFSLNELFDKSIKKIPTVKFRNPNDLNQVWAGRGRKPNWLLEELEAGKSLDDFKI